MSTIKVDINAKPYRNFDPMETDGSYADILVDGYINEVGHTVKRPGIDSTVWCDTGTGKPIDGLYWWDAKGFLMAVSNAKIFKITDSSGSKTELTSMISTISATPTAGGTGYVVNDILTISTGNGTAQVQATGVSGGVVTSVTLYKNGSNYAVGTGQATIGGSGLGCTINITAISSSTLLSGTHVSFAEHSYGANRNLYMANGGRINLTDGQSSMQSADVELVQVLACSTLDFIDGYIIAVENGTNAYHYSSILTVPVDQGYFTKEAKGDIGKAVIIDSGYIYLLGSISSECWYDDGATPFSRVGNSAMGVGIAAPNSAKAINGSVYFISDKRKVIMMQGQNYQILSTPFDQEFQDMTTVSDAIAFNMLVDGKNFYVISFPTENKTYVYDLLGQYWAQWGKWSLNINDNVTMSYNSFLATDYAYVPQWGLHLVGSSDGKIYQVGKEFYTDIGDPIRLLRRSGHDDNGSYLRKKADACRIKIKSGVGNSTLPTSIAAKCTIRWRDNGSPVWGNYHYIDLGVQGRSEFIKELKRLGQYQSRQWEIAHAEASPFVICGMELDVDLLTR